MAALGLKKKKTRRRRPIRVAAKRARTPVASPGWTRIRDLLKEGRAGANDYVVLLGLDLFDSSQLLHAVERGLPYAAFEHLVSNTLLPVDETLVLVGIPSRTLTRRKVEGRFPKDESDRLLRASRVFARALRLFEGDRTAAKRWLSTPQKALGHQSPLTVARTEVGAIEVDRLMGRLEYGVFT